MRKFFSPAGPPERNDEDTGLRTSAYTHCENALAGCGKVGEGMAMRPSAAKEAAEKWRF
jgi:hypothetical protein